MKRQNMLCLVVTFFVTITSASTVRNTTTFLDLIKEMELLPGIMELTKGKILRRTYDNPFHPEDDIQLDSYQEDNMADDLDKTGQLTEVDIGNVVEEKNLKINGIHFTILKTDDVN